MARAKTLDVYPHTVTKLFYAQLTVKLNILKIILIPLRMVALINVKSTIVQLK